MKDGESSTADRQLTPKLWERRAKSQCKGIQLFGLSFWVTDLDKLYSHKVSLASISIL